MGIFVTIHKNQGGRYALNAYLPYCFYKNLTSNATKFLYTTFVVCRVKNALVLRFIEETDDIHSE